MSKYTKFWGNWRSVRDNAQLLKGQAKLCSKWPFWKCEWVISDSTSDDFFRAGIG